MRNIIKFVLLLFAILFFVQCDFESGSPILDEFDQNYKLYDYYVDKYGNEGIVCYIHPTMAYVMVVSADEEYLSWGPINESVMNIDTIKSFSGINNHQFSLAMLQRMQADGIEKYPAQAWCYAKNKDEKFAYSGSWRLPSYYEYNMYILFSSAKLKQLNAALESIGGTPIDENNVYWTSTEDYTDYIKLKNTESDYDQNSRAIPINISKTFFTDKDKWLKKNNYYVRAFKYIYVK